MLYQPSISEIARGTGEREPYIRGLIALAQNNTASIIDALKNLHVAHMAEELDPPLPSVRARQVEDTVAFANYGGIEAVNHNAASFLLATVIDIGIRRYPNG